MPRYNTIDDVMKRVDRGAGRMYIIEAEKGVYKVGVTQRPIEKRLQALQRNTYKNLKVLYVSPEYQEIYEIEYMFKIWANGYLTNIRGEWYRMGWRRLAKTKKWLEGKIYPHTYAGGGGTQEIVDHNNMPVYTRSRLCL
jgi:hypothetical protein